MTALPHLPPAPHPVEILLVEDSEPDILLTQEAFAEARISNAVTVARDGVEALDLLRAPGATWRPDIILLDLNMPRMNGLELLRELKADPELRVIPVIVLTTSQAEEDILRSYQAYAASYIVKPIEFVRFYEAVQALGQFMLTIMRTPPRE